MSTPNVRDLEYALKSGADANLLKEKLDAVDTLSGSETAFLDGAVAGTQAASKAIVNDANANQGIAKVTQLHIGTSGSETQVTATGTEINKLAGVTAGTVTASKALVAGSSSELNALTITALTAPGIVQVGKTIQLTKAHAKVGATAGWVLGAGNNLPYMATMAASQTGGTLVVHLDGLQIGSTITGYKIVAQVESAGNTVTIDAALRAVTNVAADPTDAAIGTGMTQVSVTADTAVSQEKTGHTEVVTSGKTYYILITATTAASTDIILQNVELTVTTA